MADVKQDPNDENRWKPATGRAPGPEPQGVLPGEALQGIVTATGNAAAATSLAGRALSPPSRRAAANAVQAAIRNTARGLTAPERREVTAAVMRALAIPMDDLEPSKAAAQMERML